MFMDFWEATIARSDWDDAEKKFFYEYARDAEKHQIGVRRIMKIRACCATARVLSGKSLTEILKNLKTLGDLCVKINASKYKAETKQHLKMMLGSLYNFRHNKDRSLKYADRELKQLVEHKIKAADKRLAKAVISREEIREMTKYAKNTEDKAILWLLFESGMRNGEFEQLKKSDIQQIEEGLLVHVPKGKTGEREVVVVEATKYVNAWIEEHPLKDKNAPLWFYSQKRWIKNDKGITVPYTVQEGTLTQAGIAKRIREIVERMNESRKKQGIPPFIKDVNPHNFRHSRASELGGEPGMTEQILCKYFGWEIGSDMPRTYLHLTAEQVKRAVLRTYGKAKEEEEKKIETSWRCPRCKEDVSLALNYCGRCGGSKEGKVISLTEKLRQELDEMKKKDAARDREMEDLSRRLAAITLRQSKSKLGGANRSQ